MWRPELSRLLRSANEKPPHRNAARLSLSRRERELTVVNVRDTLNRDIGLNPALEKHTDRLPLPRERAGRAAFR
jgi:hypothetical protein